MAVTVKSAHEIQLMREAGEILAKVHEELAEIVILMIEADSVSIHPMSRGGIPAICLWD